MSPTEAWRHRGAFIEPESMRMQPGSLLCMNRTSYRTGVEVVRTNALCNNDMLETENDWKLPESLPLLMAAAPLLHHVTQCCP
jgi:hypothetical protein